MCRKPFNDIVFCKWTIYGSNVQWMEEETQFIDGAFRAEWIRVTKYNIGCSADHQDLQQEKIDESDYLPFWHIPLFSNNCWNKIKPAICQCMRKVFLCSWICHLPCTRTLLKQRVSTKHEILQSTTHRQTDRYTRHRANIFQQTGGESARKGDRSLIKEGHSGVTNFVTSIFKCDTKTW